MKESELQARIVKLAESLGYLVHHEVDSRKSRAGFPDLVLCRSDRLVMAEVKTENGKLTKKQAEWLNTLRKSGTEAYLWRPSDMPLIARILAKRKRPAA